MLAAEFDGLGDGLMNFGRDSRYCIETQPIETSRASNILSILQNACGVIVEEVRDIVQRYTIWTIVAPNQVRLRLQFLRVLIQKHEVTLALLTVTLDLVTCVGSKSQNSVSDFAAQVQMM